MKRSLSLSATSAAALVVFATTLAGSLSASAADRSIGVQPRPGNLKSFKVEDVATAPVVDVAETEKPKRPDRVKPKAFTVDDNPNGGEIAEPAPRPKKPKAFKVEDTAEVELAEPAPRPEKVKPKRPAPPKIQEFRVDEDSGEVADTPIREDEEPVETAEVERTPPQKLKPRPAPEAVTPDTEEDAAEAPAEEQPAIEEDDDEPTILRKPGYKKQRKHYAVYAAEDSYVSYDSYQPRARYSEGYAGSNCHQNSYNGY